MTNFRALSAFTLNAAQRMNVISGKNGVGKTSVLEAIYLLSTGHSFRTRQSRHLIQKNTKGLCVYGVLRDSLGAKYKLGVEKAGHSTTISLNGEKQPSVKPLAELLPVLVVNSESFDLLCGDPSNRRERIDWGLFHVEQSFMENWQSYHQAVKQRNKALQDKNLSVIRQWNHMVAKYGEVLSSLYEGYVNKFCTKLSTLAHTWFQIEGLSLVYERGWPSGASLFDTLEANVAKDIARGFTQVGPHRADLKVLINGAPAKAFFSRGQLKRFIFLMYVAQGELLHEHRNNWPLFLIDDFGAELDIDNQRLICSLLHSLPCQSFVTSIDESLWALWEAYQDLSVDKLFHVEQPVTETV